MDISKLIIAYLFILLFSPNCSWAQKYMYFVKGADMKTVSLIEPGATLRFSSENEVSINGEILTSRGSMRFTENYMVFPSIIKSENGYLDVDIYLGLSSSNYNCIFDWGNNTLEQFKLIKIDINSYNNFTLKQIESKKSKYLIDLSLNIETLEEDLKKTEDLNDKIIFIKDILNIYYNEYKILFQNDPPEIVKLNQLSNEISSKIEDIISYDKQMDSLRIFKVRVISFSNSDKSIDTFMVLKRATSLVFHTFFKDSANVLNNYLDNNFISEFSKKVNAIKILNSTYLADTTYMQVCELNIPLIEFFNLGKNSGWKLSVPNLSNGTIFKVRKLDFLKNQEFNAMCDILGSLNNLTYDCFTNKVEKSELSNENNQWKAKIEIDIMFNEKTNELKKFLLESFSYYSLKNIDIINTYINDANIEKFSIFLTPEFGKKSDLISMKTGDYIHYTFVNSMTYELVKNYLHKLNYDYYKSWSAIILDQKFYGTQDKYPTGYYYSGLSIPSYYIIPTLKEFGVEPTNKLIFNFPKASEIIARFIINLDLSESDFEKYNDSIKFVNRGRNYNSKYGGFKQTVYSYGVTLNRNSTGGPLVYSKPSTDLLPTQLVPIIKENSLMYISYNGKRLDTDNLIYLGSDERLKYYEICDCFGDTLIREFWSPSGGGKNGKKPLTAFAKPTKIEVLYSIFPTQNKNIMISYNTDWESNYDIAYNPCIYIYASSLQQYDHYKRNDGKFGFVYSGYKFLKTEKP